MSRIGIVRCRHDPLLGVLRQLDQFLVCIDRTCSHDGRGAQRCTNEKFSHPIPPCDATNRVHRCGQAQACPVSAPTLAWGSISGSVSRPARCEDHFSLGPHSLRRNADTPEPADVLEAGNYYHTMLAVLMAQQEMTRRLTVSAP